MAARGVQARARNREVRRRLEDIVEELQARVDAWATRPVAQPTGASVDEYVSNRLATVRAQIARLDLQMLQVQDADEANKLAAAIARLTDVEFALANRPKPANVRPEVTSRRRELSGPIGAVQ